MRTIKPAKTVEGRKRQIRRLIDEALAPADPLLEAVSEPTPSIAEAVAAELDRRAAAEREAAHAAAEAAYRCPTGACWRCGVSEMQLTDGSPAPWYPDGNGRHLCIPCKQLSVDRPDLDDDERRLLDITVLLGLSNGAHAVWPMRDPADFNVEGVLFAETVAEPSLEPWAHVDREAMRRAYEAVVNSSTLDTPPRPWPTRKAKPCPTCGSTERIVTSGLPAMHWPVGEDLIGQAQIDAVEASLCTGCRRAWLAQAAEASA
jgi:hypothetical protein